MTVGVVAGASMDPTVYDLRMREVEAHLPLTAAPDPWFDRSIVRWPSLALCSVVGAVLLASPAAAAGLTRVSTDPYTNTTSFHQTQVEPDSFSFGSTLVAAFQSGRFSDGGASNIGWATSTDDGASWTNGFLPGITVFAGGSYSRVSDPSVGYDAQHDVWLVASLALGSTIGGAAVLVSRSTNGGLAWSNPVSVAVAGAGEDFDKDWIVCDNTAASPFYGSCYVEYDDFGNNNQLHMARSTDGGVSWAESAVPVATVIGGQPLVQPNGTVVLVIDDGFEGNVESFLSTDGGATFVGPFEIAAIRSHPVAGSLRSDALPSAEIDLFGRIYVVWQDCRFRRACSANDIVLSRSDDGIRWRRPRRIPIDARRSGADHFIPGIAVDPTTGGRVGLLALTYYYYPVAGCSTSTCELDVGFVSSTNGGTRWSVPSQLAGPMSLTGLPLTTAGYMVGDYISTSYDANHVAHPVFMVGTGTTCTLGSVTSCDEATYTPTAGLLASGGIQSAEGGSPSGPIDGRPTRRASSR